MDSFLRTWHEAAVTTTGLFWMAFWAFAFGYLISSCIQIFVTRERMRKAMGRTGSRSVALGTLFGFLSSSCSFSALSAARSLFTKGAGLIPSLAFLLASTNLVVELGIIIALFLSWQFVVGEYVGGILLILFMWVLVRLFIPQGLIDQARNHAREQAGHDHDEAEEGDWKTRLRSREEWSRVAKQYVMEWDMVWKDVTVGFTIAGVIAAFVPKAFFQAIFVGSSTGDPSFGQVLAQSIVGPVAAFFTFIGSMGNIPLAAVLYSNGVSFAGVIAFIFSDLVVFPVLRIQAKYYGWKMALAILGIFLAALVGAAVVMHYGFSWSGYLPDPASARGVTEREYFHFDYTFFLNVVFLALTATFYAIKVKLAGFGGMGAHTTTDKVLRILAIVAFGWLGVGWLVG